MLRRIRTAQPALYSPWRGFSGVLASVLTLKNLHITGVTLAARLVGKTAAETISVMLAVFARIEPTLRKSITVDNFRQ